MTPDLLQPCHSCDQATRSGCAYCAGAQETPTVDGMRILRFLAWRRYALLVKEYIKANPMPTGVQWDADTLKAYFEQYRATIELLRGQRTQTEGE